MDLLVFEGFRYRTDRTDRAWRAAFGEFLAAREVWAAAHEGTVLPQHTRSRAPVLSTIHDFESPVPDAVFVDHDPGSAPC